MDLYELPCPRASCWGLPIEGTDRHSEVGELAWIFTTVVSSLQSLGLAVAVCYRLNVWVPLPN